MKIIEQAIYELIKNIVPDKAYWGAAPQPANGTTGAPFLRFNKNSEDTWRSIEGPSGMAQAYIQIDAYHDNQLGAAELGLQIKNLLDGYRGLVYYGNDSPQESIRIGGISFQDGLNTVDNEGEPLLYRSYGLFLVTYQTRD